MRKSDLVLLALLVAGFAGPAWADDAAEADTMEQTSAEKASQPEADDDEPNGNGVDSPKTMSGMSILGNEEAPKSLVIIPWKSSRMGEEISLADSLDDRAKPVDKDVFLRELRFHEIRSGEQT